MKTNNSNGQYFGISIIVLILAIAAFGFLGTAAKTNTVSSAPTTISSSTTTESTATTTVARLPSQFFTEHIIVVFMENENETQVVGNADAPYINNVLIPNYSIAENYHSIGHPSLVDYISTIAGSDFGVDSNNYPTRSLPYENIVDILSAHNLTWKAYMESMAGYRNGSCEGPLLNSGGIYGYFTKHDPFVYFTDITNNATRCSQIVPFTQFNSDLASGNLPSFSFVTPNILDDGHTTPLNASSCAPSGSTIQCSDNWLKSFLPGIIRNPEFANTIVFVTWDESVKPKNQNVTDTNKVLLIEVSPSSKKGFEDNTTYYSHYSLLATIEKVYNIENLGRNDTTANVMGSLFANNTPP